ncbi:MAG: methyltransferase domain-containing protein [Lachnospiraceae bacterium]|nr:methyltransferase domain-containing protein [Lachnospiraceae bacterium]
MNEKSFDDRRIAQGYAKDRPYLHGAVMEKIKVDMNLTKPFARGLDVGCGAGLSTKALKSLCGSVCGVDISAEMVAAAQAEYPQPEYRFRQSAAENICMDDAGERFDIVTAAGVINWVDEKQFLPNIKKLLNEDGFLLVYDFWISDRMEQSDGYTQWWHNHYLKEYPKPPRKETVWKNEDIQPLGFVIERQENFEICHGFDLDSFVRFMMVQSNVNEQINNGAKTADEIRRDLTETLTPIFEGDKKTLCFDGYYWILKKETAVKNTSEEEPVPEALVSVQQYIPDIIVDLKYATADNFTHQVIYDFSESYLRYGTVKKLRPVQDALKAYGMKLKIWDGFRPVKAQFKFWEILPDDTFVANPHKGYSAHSRGNAVDLTLVYADGREAEMPSEFDDFSDASNRDYSKCSKQAAANAQLLEKLMRENGFDPYFDEWWHFYDTDPYPVVENFEGKNEED